MWQIFFLILELNKFLLKNLNTMYLVMKMCVGYFLACKKVLSYTMADLECHLPEGWTANNIEGEGHVSK